MKKVFEEAKLELIRLEEDIITASTGEGGAGDGGGEGNGYDGF